MRPRLRGGTLAPRPPDRPTGGATRLDRRFRDRTAAGRELADRLRSRVDDPDVLVLALPRGGVPVAEPVAGALGAPLDVLLVRKLGVPWQPELALGAVAEIGAGVVTVWNEALVSATRLTADDLDRLRAAEVAELRRRSTTYRAGRPGTPVTGRTVVLVDDGMATGATALAAVTAVRRGAPRAVVVAVPVASAEACTLLGAQADDVLALRVPEPFLGVGRWYRDFGPTPDADVAAALARAAPRSRSE